MGAAKCQVMSKQAKCFVSSCTENGVTIKNDKGNELNFQLLRNVPKHPKN